MEQEEIERLSTLLKEAEPIAKKLRMAYAKDVLLRVTSYDVWSHILVARSHLGAVLSQLNNH